MTKKKKKKKKMGRPMLSGEPKDILIAARFGEDEAKIVDRNAEQSGKSKSEWIRGRLLGPIGKQPIPVEIGEITKYDDQPAVLYLEINGKLEPINGKFRVWLDPDCLSVSVFVAQQYESYEQFFHLPQVAVDSIRPHPTKAGVWEIQEPLVLRPAS